MWEHCISTIENDPLKLDREVDWVIKYKLIQAFQAKHDLPLGHAQVQLIDLQYHDVNRVTRRLFYESRPRDLVERVLRLRPTSTSRSTFHRQTTRCPFAGRVHQASQRAQAGLHR